jgi:putative ABC transport system ATP-binding protein
MHDAIRWGNRLLMMDSGRIIFEARDAEKSGLTVPMLVEKFTAAGRGEFDDDETLLSASPR